MTKYLLIDGNSVGNFANNARLLSVGDQQVQAVYNFLRTVHARLAALPGFQPMVLWDGLSWRKTFFTDYKANRDRAETKHEIAAQQAQHHYRTQKPFIQEALRHLGVPQVFASNMEADDLGAIMTDVLLKRGAERIILMTGDKDWLQLVASKVTWFDFAKGRVVTAENFEEFTGVKTSKAFIEVKALSGDQGDNVAGVGGIGEKGAIDFVNTYGSFSSFLSQVSIEKTIDLKKLPAKLRALVEDEDKAIIFARNIALMDLRAPQRPIPQGLSVDQGTPSLQGFSDFCSRLLFNSILEQVELWVTAFPSLSKEHVHG